MSGPDTTSVRKRADRFDAEGYRSHEARDRVWVAVLPTLP